MPCAGLSVLVVALGLAGCGGGAPSEVDVGVAPGGVAEDRVVRGVTSYR